MDEHRSSPNSTSSWRSLRELHGAEEVSELRAHEFMNGVTEGFDLTQLPVMSRKRFLALLTASAAVAAAGCSNYRDKGEIVPYSKRPEEIIPGVANLYASTCTGCANACGILIKTREGRPIKVDGNPDHPVNRGALCARGQASILNLYDPSRLRTAGRGSSSGFTADLTWAGADAELHSRFAECVSTGKQIAVLTHGITSPTTRTILAGFASIFPTTRIFSYDVLGDGTRRAAWQACYGQAPLPVIAWEKARTIVTLEADILGTEGHIVEQIRKYAAGRDVARPGEFSRLYAVEGSVTLTGTNADYRLRVRPDAQMDFVLALLNEVAFVRGEATIAPAIVPLASSVSIPSFVKAEGVRAELVAKLVDDLLAGRGSSIVYAGNALPREVHVAVNYLNEILGNTALYAESTTDHPGPASTADELRNLVADMEGGRVGIVIHVGTNPVFDFPPSFRYREALKQVPTRVSLTEVEDETSQWCTHVLPVHHAFEAWGDHAIRQGVTSLQQPVIAPLYETRQTEGIFLAWMAGEGSYKDSMVHEYLRTRWEKDVHPRMNVPADFKSFWFGALHDGVVLEPVAAPPARSFSAGVLASLPEGTKRSNLALGLMAASAIGDGRFANNGWLQELPHPVSKVVWDNYAAVSPQTAADLGVASSDLLEISAGGIKKVLPVFVQPGQADRYVSVELGYGRTNAGPIGSGVGTDVNLFIPESGPGTARIIPEIAAARVEGTYTIVSSQEHHALDAGPLDLKDLARKREIIREGTLTEFTEDPDFLWKDHPRPELFSIATEVEYSGVKWAMAIDLNKCVGCNACVAGCNVENNIPVVGKEQVQKGREMNWIRLDRYYSGPAEDPTFSHQPMLCQHCDQAPCENVCPVVATTHSADGLNQMAYNRCVGTKYCSNNCPFKVRRFNFFNFRDHLADGYYEQEPLSLLHNPEVTVRSRGVMEKCTFCIQRIMEARQHATEAGRALRGSDVRTACEQACPARAIVFGDMNDPESEISRQRRHSLGYHVLEDLNVKPNVTYIARLRNIHPEKAS